jgi:predicted ABC-type transport system involved in lysophospholipase L1 biosynthesis ATPase subunit
LCESLTTLALHRADENALTRYRRDQLGIVFQFLNLLPTMTALENVMFPLLLQHTSKHSFVSAVGSRRCLP